MEVDQSRHLNTNVTSDKTLPRRFNLVDSNRLRRFGQLALPLSLLISMAFAPSPAQADSCSYQLGFKTLHDLDPAFFGDCLDNQSYNSNGDATQHTTRGLMVWRSADNWTAGTDGSITEINGPNGLVRRPNNTRLPFESDYWKYRIPLVGFTPDEETTVRAMMDEAAALYSTPLTEDDYNSLVNPQGMRYPDWINHMYPEVGGVGNLIAKTPKGRDIFSEVQTIFKAPALGCPGTCFTPSKRAEVIDLSGYDTLNSPKAARLSVMAALGKDAKAAWVAGHATSLGMPVTDGTRISYLADNTTHADMALVLRALMKQPQYQDVASLLDIVVKSHIQTSMRLCCLL